MVTLPNGNAPSPPSPPLPLHLLPKHEIVTPSDGDPPSLFPPPSASAPDGNCAGWCPQDVNPSPSSPPSAQALDGDLDAWYFSVPEYQPDGIKHNQKDERELHAEESTASFRRGPVGLGTRFETRTCEDNCVPGETILHVF